jgi:iron complex outermembrane recepter protein
MNKHNELTRSIRFALIASLAVSSVAIAQEKAATEETTLDTVQVTGSRILRRADAETAQLVLTLTSDDIQRSGLTSIGDVLQNLASVGPSINTLFNNGGDGSTTVDLRNLGAGRTLVLVDGHRWVAGLGGAVDLNTIPTAIIERIEVLKDGASSIYGSDAIAGVVNIITKSDFNGAEANGFYGQNSEGDGTRYSGDFTFGGNLDKGNIVVSASFTKEEPVFAGDRPISAVPSFGIPFGVNGSSTTPFGRYGIGAGGTNPITGAGGTVTNIPGQNGTPGRPNIAGYKPFSFTTDAFNFAPDNYLLTPQERGSIFAAGRYEIFDGINFKTHFLFNQRQSEQLLAPNPVTLGLAPGTGGLARTIRVSAANPYNPFGVEITRIQRRFTEGKSRLFSQDVDTTRFGGSFDGSFDLAERSFYWDAGYAFTENDENDVTTGLYNVRRISQALTAFDSDPTAAGFAPVCGTAGPNAATPLVGATLIAGCVPLNIFGAVGSATPAQLDYISFIAHDKANSETQNYFANISSTLFTTGAGDAGFALGYEHRREEGSNEPDAIIVAGETTGNASKPTNGRFSLDEFYGEVNIPILSDVQFAELLEVRLAGRYSDFSNFGNTSNFSAGFQWKPIADLKLRGNFNQGFRAPTLADLFQGQADNFPTVSDPCDVRSVNAFRAQNCVGAPANYRLANTQIRSTVGGDPETKAETADTLTVGFVYSPEYVANLGIALDWWKISIDNTISGRDEQTLLNACYRRPVQDRSACARIVRAPGSFDIVDVLNITENIGSTDAEGLDLNVTYKLPEYDFGTVGFAWDSTYYINSESDNLGYDPSQPVGPGNLPRSYTVGRAGGTDADYRLKSNFLTTWEMGGFSASWTMRYASALVEDCSRAVDNGFPELCSNVVLDTAGDFVTGGLGADGVDLPRNRLGATTYHDLRAAYRGEWGGTIALGINNAFDKNVPISYSATNNSFLPTYDVPGRFYYVSYNHKF